MIIQRGGSSNGLSASVAFDRWFRYPAGFSPSSLKLALDAVDVSGDDKTVLDPFAGTGSVGTASVLRNSSFIGIEAHPEIAQLANLKFQRPGPAAELMNCAASVVDLYKPLDVQDEHDLMRRCFDGSVLSKLAGLREAIISSPSLWTDYLKWALLGTLRDVASVKVGWPYQRPSMSRSAPHRDPIKRFLQRVQWMADDLAGASEPLQSRVVCADSRESSGWAEALDGQIANACVSSPPYLNNFDYADATRLELYFWGSARSWKQMCETVRSGMVIATTQQTAVPLARAAREQLCNYPTFTKKFGGLIESLEAQRSARARGKEYDRVIGPYFLGIVSVISNLFDSLRPGAKVAWLVGDSAPYGVYIDTPALIGSLAVDVGFDSLEDLEVRTRGGRWTGSGVRHAVELSERLISFSKPSITL